MNLQTQKKRSFLSLHTSKIHFTIKKHSYILLLIIFIIIIIIKISSIKNPNNFHYYIGFPSSKNYEKQGCNYSNGEWIWDENYPFHGYNESCRFLDPGFRCHENGRVNQSFRHWRWQPRGCDLPRYYSLQCILLFLIIIEYTVK